MSNAASPGKIPVYRKAYQRQDATVGTLYMTTAMDTSATTTSSRRGTKRAYSGGRGAGLTKRQRQSVTQLITRRQELKYKATASAGNVVVTFAGLTDDTPFNVAQGDSDTTRDGDRLMWCGNIEFRYQITNPGLATSTNTQVVRVVIYQWHPFSVPTGATLFLNGSTGGVDYTSQFIHDNRQEYTILYDKTHTVIGNALAATTPGTSTSVSPMYFAHIPLKRARKQCQLQNGTTVGTNKLYMFTICSTNVAGNPQIAWTMKTFFRDS